MAPMLKQAIPTWVAEAGVGGASQWLAGAKAGK